MWLDKRVTTLIGRKLLPGRFGVEVEVDGDCSGILANERSLYWNYERDGSLGNAGAAEFVFAKPLDLKVATVGVTNLYAQLDKYSVRVGDSMRAGVHVHLNCLELSMRQLFTLITAYYCLEPLIMEKFGPDRKGNLFCLGLSDAEFALEVLEGALRNERIDRLETENIRYAALNLNALTKYGSLEFRALMTPKTSEPITDWLLFLDTLYTSCLRDFATPADVITQFSAGGVEATLRTLVGEKGFEWLSTIPNYEGLLFAGIRDIQAFALINDWN